MFRAILERQGKDFGAQVVPLFEALMATVKKFDASFANVEEATFFGLRVLANQHFGQVQSLVYNVSFIACIYRLRKLF